jgi:hypothetical protein
LVIKHYIQLKKYWLNIILFGNVPLYDLFEIKGKKKEEYVSTCFYSQVDAKALHYYINPQYLNYDEMLTVENKYADKHRILFKTWFIFFK